MKKIIIIVLVVVIAAAGAAAFFILKGKGDKEPEAPKVVAYHTVGEPIITNIKSATSNNSFIKVSVVLGLSDAKAGEEIAASDGAMRDIILKILRTYSKEDLSGENASTVMEELGKKIKKEIVETLEIDYIVEVYFNDFLIQG